MKKDITIVCIDTRDSERETAAATVAYCQQVFPCKEAILFTDKRLPVLPELLSGISIISNIRSCNQDRGYDFFVLSQLVNYIQTSHYLIIQTDGFILNPQAWDDHFLDYDYIGAPWAYSPLHDWFPHKPTGPNNSVGNGGFSLRSTKLGYIAQHIFCTSSRDPNFKTENWYPEDCFICRDIRPGLENKYEIKFAPEDIALKFSCENKPYTNQFGYHGSLTMQMNNIKKVVCQK